MTELVTCCIPCYKEPDDILERAVRSAYSAGCHRVMVYDDSGENDTPFWLKYNGIPETPIWGSYIHLGASGARNTMIVQAITDLIICLDADDELCDIAPLIEAWTEGTFVYGNHNEINGDIVTHHKGAPIGTLPNKLVSGVTFLFGKSDWQKVGGFDPDFSVCEDWAYMCALVNAGVQGKYIDTIVYNRYIQPEGNERTALAGHYWSFYRNMARRKYPALFSGTS